MRQLLVSLCVGGLLAGCSFAPNRGGNESGRGAAVPSPPRDVVTIPDAVPRAEPRSRYGNPAFYEVFGRRYHVLATADDYVEIGLASWYGPGFHAETTSNGEAYDMYAMTAAHKTLPLPAYARVTNLDTGKSIVVRINDRGPFVDGRIIDLSYTAAAKLDMIRAGTARVEVRTLRPTGPGAVAPVSTTVAAPSGPLYIQVGAFGNRNNAEALRQRLLTAVTEQVSIQTDSNRALHRVRVGPLRRVEEFDRVMAQLAELGVADARLAGE